MSSVSTLNQLSLDARREPDSCCFSPSKILLEDQNIGSMNISALSIRRRCQLLSSLACCIVHSTSGFSRIVEPMMPLPFHLSVVNNDNINRSTTTPPPPFSIIATSPLSPNSFAGQVESALLSRFRQSTIERVLSSWRYLGEFNYHFEIVYTMNLQPSSYLSLLQN